MINNLNKNCEFLLYTMKNREKLFMEYYIIIIWKKFRKYY